MIIESFINLKHLLTNKRLQQDIRSLKAAKNCYIQYAWELIEDFRLDEYLKNPHNLNEIAQKSNIKDKQFLETVLDLLVGAKYLKYNDGKYALTNFPKSRIENDLKHLEKFCPGSTEWTHWLRTQSKKTLCTGKKVGSASFSSKKGINLWEKVMKESPFALRQIAIQQFANKLNNNNKIIDVGCGGGIGLEEIILKSESPIRLFGLEVSKPYITSANKRLKKLQKELTGTKKENCKNTKFVIKDLLREEFHEKFDVIFLSLVVNHIHSDDYKKFFTNLKMMMKSDAILVTFQFLNTSKFERSPMWVMHNIPSHKDFPYKNDYVKMLKQVFPKVSLLFNGIIVVCKLRK